MKKKLHVFFSGSVQGVGFRYTTERIARRHPVTGYVRNLPDGRVELLAEGDESALQEFLKAVREGFNSYIRDADVKWDNATGEFERFGTKF
ncbi:MAG: acylphosphatase [Candidatus Omnitrophica bacterium]|nr:acylphosphatase [Candidatus Omnitrophota bacterium]